MEPLEMIRFSQYFLNRCLAYSFRILPLMSITYAFPNAGYQWHNVELFKSGGLWLHGACAAVLLGGWRPATHFIFFIIVTFALFSQMVPLLLIDLVFRLCPSPCSICHLSSYPFSQSKDLPFGGWSGVLMPYSVKHPVFPRILTPISVTNCLKRKRKLCLLTTLSLLAN